jgi:hypothetical protein
MIVDRYAPEDVYAWLPEVADQTDLVLKELDHLLEDDTSAWAALDSGGSDPADAHCEAPVQTELPGNSRAGG